MTIEPLSDIIMTVYDCALTPDGWFKALRRIVDFSGSTACRLVIDTEVTAAVAYTVERGRESKSSGLLLTRDERTLPERDGYDMLAVGEPMIWSRASAKVRPAARAGSWPGCEGAQASDVVTMLLLDSAAGRIVFEAAKDEGTYSDSELDRMRLLSPHICRAVCISDSLNINRMTSEMLEASLELLNTGIYLLGRQARVIYLNRLARAQVKSGAVLRLVQDRLFATNPDAQGLLQAELSDIAAHPERQDGAGAAIALSDGQGAGFVAHILPLPWNARSHLADHSAAIAAIFVQDPATAPSRANAAFARLYGLTEGELRFLDGLTPGLSVAEAADRLGISEATAKTHLRRIFSKTRTSKQAELLYLLMISTPPTSAA